MEENNLTYGITTSTLLLRFTFARGEQNYFVFNYYDRFVTKDSICYCDLSETFSISAVEHKSGRVHKRENMALVSQILDLH